MTTSALLLVLGAAVLHAVWNIAAKRVDGDASSFVWLYGTGSALLWLPIGIVLAWSGEVDVVTLLWVSAVSGVLHNLYGVVLNTGYRKADLGVVYPVARGSGPLISMAFALLVLGESVSALNLLGGLVVVAGVAVVTGAGVLGAHRSGRTVDGLKWGVATGATIAAYTVWDGVAVSGKGLDPLLYYAASAAWQSLTLAPVAWASQRRVTTRKMLREHAREIAVVSVLSPLAYVLVLVAMQTTPIALVAPARETSIIVGTLLAWWLFRESRPVPKVVGACVVLGGVGLLAL